MDTVKNLTDSTINSLKGRLADPIIGNYFITFIIYNWEIFVNLFSTKNVDLKIAEINDLLSSKALFPSSPFLIPLLISLIYLFILPKVFRPAHKWLLGKKVLSENDRFEAEMNLSPNQKRIGELRDQLEVEIQRNNDLSSLKNSHEETIRLQKEQLLRYEDQLKNSTVKGAENSLAQEAIFGLEKQGLLKDFINFAPVILTSSYEVGGLWASERASSLAGLLSLGVLERFKVSTSSATEVWKLSLLGNDVFRIIQSQKS